VKKIGILLLLAGCTGLERAPMPEGRRLYLAKCTSCHSEYEPAKYSREVWVANVDKMGALKKVHLSPEERAQILQYLTGDPAGGLVAAPPSERK
jgi:mono/diheme cytochrome c family protein